MIAQLIIVIPIIGILLAAYLGSTGYKGRQHVLGIDLGTTYSVVAVKKGNDDPEVIPNHETGHVLTASVVSYLPDGSAVVGQKADKKHRKTNPERTIFHSKRFIGRPLCAVSVADFEYHPYEVGNPGWRRDGESDDSNDSSNNDNSNNDNSNNDNSNNNDAWSLHGWLTALRTVRSDGSVMVPNAPPPRINRAAPGANQVHSSIAWKKEEPTIGEKVAQEIVKRFPVMY
jgi:hypothetical protein